MYLLQRCLAAVDSPAQASAGPDLTEPWMRELDQNDARLGFRVTSAGGVNGDGYDDVVAGAPFDDDGDADRGRIDLYLWSATGLDESAAWTLQSERPEWPFVVRVVGRRHERRWVR